MTRFPDYHYESTRRIVYGEGLTFLPVCPQCRRYVKADDSNWRTDAGDNKPNATCSRCGRVTMPCEGWIP